MTHVINSLSWIDDTYHEKIDLTLPKNGHYDMWHRHKQYTLLLFSSLSKLHNNFNCENPSISEQLYS